MSTKYPARPNEETAGLNSWPSDPLLLFPGGEFCSSVQCSCYVVNKRKGKKEKENFDLGSVVCTPIDGTGFSGQSSCGKARTEGNLLLPGLVHQSKETQLAFVMWAFQERNNSGRCSHGSTLIHKRI